MKIFLNNSILIFLFLLTPLVSAQDIQVITHGMIKYEPAGTLEIVFDFEVINISNLEQTVFEVRTINDLPTGWSLSLCLGKIAFHRTWIALPLLHHFLNLRFSRGIHWSHPYMFYRSVPLLPLMSRYRLSNSAIPKTGLFLTLQQRLIQLLML